LVQPGTILEGKYEILDKIREGGMGTIYRVRHRLLEEIRVVKVMKPGVVADADLRRRFIEEARTATRLKHPNICTIHDFAIDESGMAYLVMEFIEGVNVSDLLKLHGQPPLPLVLEIAHQSLLALGFLHRKGIVHRDVAPDNIMLTRDEHGAPIVKLIDLGIAKVAEAPVEATATGVFLGKLKYASPEQYGSLPKGHRLDGRSDLYGLGVVLYELSTGSLPFEGSSVVELLKAHVFAPPRPFSETDPSGRVPTDLRGALLKALQKKREHRFESAEDFDREILAIRSRHGRPEDLEAMRVALARIRQSSGGVRIQPATPGAQGEIDRQFAAVKTPTPARHPGENDRTAIAPGPSASKPAKAREPSRPAFAETEVDTTPIPKPGGRVRVWSLVAAAAVALGALVWTMTRREPVAPPSPAPEPTAIAAALPTAAVAGLPEPTLPPPPEPTVEERPEPTVPPPTAVRREPTRARPPTQRPQVAIAPPYPTVPAPAATPVAMLPATAPPAAAIEAPRSSPLAPTPRPAPTESDRIRETIRLYETAQDNLDAALYVRVFPGVDRGRIEQAFSSFRSQSVEFEIRRIEIAPQGNTAQVFGFETRVAVPKAGNDLRVTADRVVQLEKRGDAWVIVSVR
jgi:serine/threonine-protein kinase